MPGFCQNSLLSGRASPDQLHHLSVIIESIRFLKDKIDAHSRVFKLVGLKGCFSLQ